MGDRPRWSRGVTGNKSSKDMGDTTSGCFGRSRHALVGDLTDGAAQRVLSRPRSAASTASPSCVERFGISRKNGYKWLNRYRDDSRSQTAAMSFADQSRRPHRSPTAISAEVEAAIVELRRQRPHWGPKKLRVVLAKQKPELALPSESTFAAVLKRHGLVKAAPQAGEEHAVHVAARACARSPMRCGRSTSRVTSRSDARGATRSPSPTRTAASSSRASRFPTRGRRRSSVLCGASSTSTGFPKRSAATTALRSRRAALPDFRRCRCGGTSSAFATSASIRGTPNRMGATSACTSTSSARRHLRRRRRSPSSSIRFDQFRARFNQERPHEALEQKTPHEFYEVSSRRLPTAVVGKGFRVRHGGRGAARLEGRADRDASRSLLLEYDPGARAHRIRLVRSAIAPASCSARSSSASSSRRRNAVSSASSPSRASTSVQPKTIAGGAAAETVTHVLEQPPVLNLNRHPCPRITRHPSPDLHSANGCEMLYRFLYTAGRRHPQRRSRAVYGHRLQAVV